MADDYAYVGEQDQSSNVTETNAQAFVVDSRIARVNTATIVKIIRAPYDKDGNDIAPGSVVPVGYVDVQPMVNQLDGRGKPTAHGTIYRLSYHRSQGGKNAIIADPEKDDIGQMVVNSRDTSAVRSTNEVSNPGSRRRFDLADGIYHGSPQQKEAPVQYVAFTPTGVIIHDKNGWQITTNADGVRIVAKGNTIVMGDSGVLINGALISKTGDVTTAHGTSLDQHVNTGVTPGGSDTGPPP